MSKPNQYESGDSEPKVENVFNDQIIDQIDGLSQIMLDDYVEDIDGYPSRSVTRESYPFRYLLTERIVNKDNVRTLYDITSISAKLKDTGLRKYSRYYIVPEDGLLASTHSELPNISEMDEGDKQNLRDSLRFEVENGFVAPSLTDYEDVFTALEIATEIGVKPYERK